MLLLIIIVVVVKKTNTPCILVFPCIKIEGPQNNIQDHKFRPRWTSGVPWMQPFQPTSLLPRLQKFVPTK